jgi:hypothetical protein
MPLDADPRAVARDPARSPQELNLALKHLARSTDEADHAVLREALGDGAILARLDDADAYRRPRHTLRLATAMDRLGKNTSAPAAATIAALTKSKAFLAHEHRVDLLIEASAVCRPPAPEIVAFWSANADPAGIHAEIVAIALAKNATDRSTALLETLCRDARFDLARRIDWFRVYVLQWRTEPANVALARRLTIDAALPRDLRTAAVESIFDYRPEEWFPPHGGAEPQPWSVSTRTGRDAARALAKDARDALRPLDPRLDAAITAALTQFDALDEGDSSNAGGRPGAPGGPR